MMNYERILQELELEARLIDEKGRELGEAIGVLKRLVGKPSVADTPQQAQSRKARRSSANVDWARARQQYENGGIAVSRIALNFKVAQSAVYRRIKEENWQRPEPKDAD